MCPRPSIYIFVISAASSVSNHSSQPNHVCAHRTQRIILNTDGKVIAKLCAPYTISVQGVICVSKGIILAPTCRAVSAPLKDLGLFKEIFSTSAFFF